MLEETAITCPYCGEAITIVVDGSAGDQRYVEDCFVCCQPIELVIAIGPDAHLSHIEALPENG